MPDVLRDEPLDGEDRDFLTRPPVQLLALRPIVKPGSRGKIHGLSNVEACGEACVVRAWHGQDVLARPLERLANPDVLLLEVGGRDHGHDVEENVRVFLEEYRLLLLNCLLKLFTVTLWHGIPLLGLAPVTVIYRVQHQVFIVPAESGVAHANVEPRDVDSADVVAARELHQ